jgi:transcription elongation factor Elf1
MRKLIGKLICRFKGRHQRGRLISKDQTHKTFECPVCGRNTIYPVKAKA